MEIDQRFFIYILKENEKCGLSESRNHPQRNCFFIYQTSRSQLQNKPMHSITILTPTAPKL